MASNFLIGWTPPWDWLFQRDCKRCMNLFLLFLLFFVCIKCTDLHTLIRCLLLYILYSNVSLSFNGHLLVVTSESYTLGGASILSILNAERMGYIRLFQPPPLLPPLSPYSYWIILFSNGIIVYGSLHSTLKDLTSGEYWEIGSVTITIYDFSMFF